MRRGAGREAGWRGAAATQATCRGGPGWESGAQGMRRASALEHEERSVGVAPRVEELVVPVQRGVGDAERKVARAHVEVALRRRDARQVSVLLG